MNIRKPLSFAGTLLLVLAIGAGTSGDVFAKKKKKDTENFNVQEMCDRLYAGGMEFKKNSRFIDAKESFIGAVEACPDFLNAYLQLGNIAIQLRDYEGAIEYYDKAAELDSENKDVLEALAYAYTASGRVDDAEDIYLRLLEEEPTRIGAIQNLAFTYEKQGKPAEATMMYSRAFELDATIPEMEDNLARKYLDQKMYAQALHFYEKLTESQPDELDNFRKLAYFHYKIKDYEGAVLYYEDLLERDPEGTNALNEHKILAFCLNKLGRTSDAFEHYDYIMEKETGEMNNYYRYASALVDAGQLTKAEEVVNKGLGVNSAWGCLTYVKGEIREKRALIAQEAQEFERARELFRQAKATFEQAIGDAQCGGNAVKQVDRMDQLIDRLNKIEEKAGQQ